MQTEACFLFERIAGVKKAAIFPKLSGISSFTEKCPVIYSTEKFPTPVIEGKNFSIVDN